MDEQICNAELFAKRCEQLRQHVAELQNSFSVPKISPVQKIDYSRLGQEADRPQRQNERDKRRVEQSAQAADSVKAFLEQLRLQYQERMEIERREEAKRAAVAILREEKRKKDEAAQIEREQEAVKAQEEETARREALEKQAAFAREEAEKNEKAEQRLKSFYQELDCLAKPLERMQVIPEPESITGSDKERTND